ncbi:MAG: PQQ-binding-like beta-propeller repeat protein [Gemmataceae bacterium]
MRHAAITTAVLSLAAGLLTSAAPGPAPDADERLLVESGLPADGPGLLDYLRRRFASPLTEGRLRQLIEQLGDDAFVKREQASRQLVLIGRPARPLLTEALKHSDLEVRHRAGRCLRQIGGDGMSSRVLAAALRVLARRNPDGAVAMLVEHMPALGEEPFAPAAREALASLAVRDGKAHPAIAAALTNAVPARRHAAAVALLRAGGADQGPALLRRLADDDRDVRFDVALGLARLGKKEAIPVLIAELDQKVTPRFGQAEELLLRLAADKGPTLADAEDDTRRDYRKAWERWWRENEASADLSALRGPGRLLGRTVVVLLDDNQVLGLGADDKVRWKIDRVQMVLDVQPLPGDRVLLAEYNGKRVTERTSKGQVVWEVKADEPLAAQRLPDGHTLVATKDALVEVDRDGREVFQYAPPAGTTIMRASKLPGGDVLLVTQVGVGTQLVRLDALGQEAKRFVVDVGTSGGRLDVTAAGHVLVPEMYSNRVAEYDRAGQVVRTLPIDQPIACVVLPNGNVVVTSMTQKRAVELDRSNKEVWQYRRDTRVTRAVRY